MSSFYGYQHKEKKILEVKALCPDSNAIKLSLETELEKKEQWN